MTANLATLHFISQAPQSGQPVVITSWMELLAVASLFTILAAFATGYHYLECHEPGCRKLGRHRLGHLRLCGPHHPDVPGTGVDRLHIEETHRRLSGRDQEESNAAQRGRGTGDPERRG